MSVTLEESLASRRPARPTPETPNSVFSQFRLDGRVAVITGAADGIGFAVAEAYAEAGAHLALWYNRNDAAIAKGAELSRTYGVTVKAYQVRVQDPAAVQAAVAEVRRDFGGALDVFVANAGMGIPKGLLEMSVDEYRELMAVNVDGVVYCAKYAGEVFRERGKGVLIITSSISAHIVNVPMDQPVYNASKAAVTHLGKSLAREWREFARVVSFPCLQADHDDELMCVRPEYRQPGILRDQDGCQSERRERGQSNGGAGKAGRCQRDQGLVFVSCERCKQLHDWQRRRHRWWLCFALSSPKARHRLDTDRVNAVCNK